MESRLSDRVLNMLAVLLCFSFVFYSCPARAFLCAGGGRQGQSIKLGLEKKKKKQPIPRLEKI